MIKEIVKNLSLSSTLRINEISKDLEAQGKNVFKFGFGQSPFKVPDDVVLELKNNANKNNYLPVQGLPELREAIAKNLNKEISIKKIDDETLNVKIFNNDILAAIVGEFNKNLIKIEKLTNTQVFF